MSWTRGIQKLVQFTTMAKDTNREVVILIPSWHRVYLSSAAARFPDWSAFVLWPLHSGNRPSWFGTWIRGAVGRRQNKGAGGWGCLCLYLMKKKMMMMRRMMQFFGGRTGFGLGIVLTAVYSLHSSLVHFVSSASSHPDHGLIHSLEVVDGSSGDGRVRDNDDKMIARMMMITRWWRSVKRNQWKSTTSCSSFLWDHSFAADDEKVFFNFLLRTGLIVIWELVDYITIRVLYGGLFIGIMVLVLVPWSIVQNTKKKKTWCNALMIRAELELKFMSCRVVTIIMNQTEKRADDERKMMLCNIHRGGNLYMISLVFFFSLILFFTAAAVMQP